MVRHCMQLPSEDDLDFGSPTESDASSLSSGILNYE